MFECPTCKKSYKIIHVCEFPEYCQSCRCVLPDGIKFLCGGCRGA